MKSWPSAVIRSFQDFEQENLTRQKCYFVDIHDKYQTCSIFTGGAGPLLFKPLQRLSLGGSWTPDPPEINAPV